MDNATVCAFVGIDVQSDRASPFAVLDTRGRLIDSGWAQGETPSEIGGYLEATVRRHAGGHPGAVAVGVESPSRPLPKRRSWYWNGRQKTWRRRRAGEKGWGRHSDVVVAALRLANPQWTPPLGEAPEWMRVGFAIFAALESFPRVFEVFPSASYSMLRGVHEPMVSIDFASFADGPKDMLDACVGAVTVREYVLGRGMAVGNGDGLGAIILPRPVDESPSNLVLSWPEPTPQDE